MLQPAQESGEGTNLMPWSNQSGGGGGWKEAAEADRGARALRWPVSSPTSKSC